jgi:hypothetical protein
MLGSELLLGRRRCEGQAAAAAGALCSVPRTWRRSTPTLLPAPSSRARRRGGAMVWPPSGCASEYLGAGPARREVNNAGTNIKSSPKLVRFLQCPIEAAFASPWTPGHYASSGTFFDCMDTNSRSASICVALLEVPKTGLSNYANGYSPHILNNFNM